MNNPEHSLTRVSHESTVDGVLESTRHQPSRQPIVETVAPGPQIQSYLEIPFMHKRLIMFTLLLGACAGWLAIVMTPKEYESSSKIMVKVGRANVSLDPTATPGASLMSLQKTQEEEIVSALEILNSREVAVQVVDALGQDMILGGNPADSESSADKPTQTPVNSVVGSVQNMKKHVGEVLLRAGVKDAMSGRELAIRKVQASIGIDSPPGSSVIVVNGRAQTPELAQTIVASVTDCFVEEHLKSSHTEGSYSFFVMQCDATEAELNQLVAKRAEFMQQRQVVSVSANRDLLSGQLAGVDRDLLAASGDYEQALAEVEELKRKLLVVDDEVVAEKNSAADATWSGMRQQFYELELEQQRLESILANDHPRLLQIKSRLAGSEEILRQLDSERVDANTTLNPIKQAMERDLHERETRMVGLESLIREKQSQRTDLELKTDELLEDERALIQMDRDIEMTANNLSVMRTKLEEARVMTELHREKFSNIHVFQPATFVERPVAPSKKILGFGFLFIGLMSGVCLSFVKEFSSPVLRTAEDVERGLGVPVLATVSKSNSSVPKRLTNGKAANADYQKLMSEIVMFQHRVGRLHGCSVGVIGVDEGAGASGLAVNLALASGNEWQLKTVLVDADSKSRSVSKMFGLNGTPGLVEMISGDASSTEVRQNCANWGIDLVASSADCCKERLVCEAPEIMDSLKPLLSDCDLLFVDLPALSRPDRTVALAQYLDCVLVVAESEKTMIAEAGRLLGLMGEGKTSVLGVVLTNQRQYLPKVIRRFFSIRV